MELYYCISQPNEKLCIKLTIIKQIDFKVLTYTARGLSPDGGTGEQEWEWIEGEFEVHIAFLVSFINDGKHASGTLEGILEPGSYLKEPQTTYPAST